MSEPNETTHRAIPDLSLAECQDLLTMLQEAMQITSPNMGGKHHWRISTMRGLVGPTPIEALINAACLRRRCIARALIDLPPRPQAPEGEKENEDRS